MKILLLMDNRADANWGSQATTSGLVRLLCQRFPGAEILGIPRRYGKPKLRQLRKACARKAVQMLREDRWTGVAERLAIRLMTGRWIHHALEADLIVVNGEGTLRPQMQCRFWLPILAYLKRTVAAPIWVVNCSVMCTGHPDEDLFAKALGCADRVAVREPASMWELRRLGVRADQAVDCAVMTEPAPRGAVRSKLAALGVRERFVVMTGSASIEQWPVETQRQLIRQIRDTGRQVLYASSEPEDAENLRRLDIDIPHLTHAEGDHRLLMGVQACADALLGGRFHPSLLAAMAGTPFVAGTSNTHKMAGLMEVLGVPEMLLQMSDEEGQARQLARVLSDGEPIAATMGRSLSKWRHLAWANVDGRSSPESPEARLTGQSAPTLAAV